MATGDCHAPGTTDAFLSVYGAKAIFSDAVVSTYADRVGAQGGPGNWVRCVVMACLRANRIVYRKRVPGDCGTASRLQGNLGGALTQTGLKIGLSTVPIVGNALAALVDFLPFGHHVQAVANEQATLCDVAVNWAGFADAMETALQQGQINITDAVTKLQQLHDALKSELSRISHPVNAGWGYGKALDALMLFNKEAIYPALVPSGLGGVIGSTITGIKQALGIISTVPSTGVATASVAGGTPQSKTLLIVGGLAAVAGILFWPRKKAA